MISQKAVFPFVRVRVVLHNIVLPDNAVGRFPFVRVRVVLHRVCEVTKSAEVSIATMKKTADGIPTAIEASPWPCDNVAVEVIM